MDDYKKFIESKMISVENSGFEVDESLLNKNLFGFQKFIVKIALQKGRYAIFADCGLGKTLMQLEWARLVSEREQKPVLILCPLAVSGQTIKEGEKFGIDVKRVNDINGLSHHGIYITNYEQLDNIECSNFVGIVLDESSILKNFTGVMKNKIIESFYNTKYKLACTATPAPNDPNEIGNHSQFLNILDAQDMRSRWFVREDGMSNYRLKKHAISDFYSWVASWAIMIENPSDIGFNGSKYILPELKIEKIILESKKQDNGKLFNDDQVNATSFNKELRRTINNRIESAAKIANSEKSQCIVWVNQDIEEKLALELIDDSKAVRGSMKPEIKESLFFDFANGKYKVLITKKKIAQFGLNFQNCHRQIFATLDFSFEALYQSIRRSWRFGQEKQVDIYVISTDTMGNVKESIEKKQNQFKEMKKEMIRNMKGKEYGLMINETGKIYETQDYKIFNGDSVEKIDLIEDDSIDFSIFSPPFSNIFTYSNDYRDMGNSEDDEQFFKHTGFLLKKLYKKIKPGRLVAIHTKDIPRYKGSSGYSGMYDFTGDYHRSMEKAGFKFHSKVTIWTDPVLERARTNTQRLLYKQVREDSSYSGVGMAEFLTIFRKWEGDESTWVPINNKNFDNFPLETWQKWASPVWMDIERVDVLNDYRGAKDENDEKHICPLQLGVIERSIAMWSNPGDVVFTPFMGIGSEVYQAVKMGRKGIGIELKESYFEVAKKNIETAVLENCQMSLI